VVFSMNEPVQLRKAGVNINTIEVSQLASLASIGLVTGDNLIASNPELVQKMVRAVTRGLKDTIANPEGAFERTIKVAPDAKGADPELQRQVLKATTGFMVADNVKGQALGYSDPQVWAASEKFLADQKLLASKVDPTRAYTNKFVSLEVGRYN
jgi:NitT/TauT family transport system substrate-binding protein